MVKTSYIYSRNFFYKLAQKRFLNNLSEIKRKNGEMTISEITATNKAVISSIRKGKINKNNKSFIPDKVALEIKDNVKIEYNEEVKYYYSSLSELFWGTEDEIKKFELEFFYCILKDMLSMFCKTKDMSCSYTILIQNMLKTNIEYAEVLSLLNVESIYRLFELQYKGDFPQEIMYSDMMEWKETNLKIPSKIYSFTESRFPIFHDFNNNGIFPMTKLDDIIEIENKAILGCYELLIKKEQMNFTKYFFESLQEFEILRKITKGGKRVPEYVEQPTFEVIEKVLNQFIENKLIPLFKDNVATIEDIGYRIHDMLFYQYMNILNLIYLDETGERYEISDSMVNTNLYKVSNTEINTVDVINTKLTEVVEKKEHEFTRSLLHEDLEYIKKIKKIYLNYNDKDNKEYEKINEYRENQFSIMSPQQFVENKESRQIVGIEYRKILGDEEYLLVGDKYNIL